MLAQLHRFPWGESDSPQIWIAHYGSKSTPLIAQLCREIGLRSRVIAAADLPEEWMRAVNAQHLPRLVILSGGEHSVYQPNAPGLSLPIYESMRLNAVLFGICYGAQLLAMLAGGTVEQADKAEFGQVQVNLIKEYGLYFGGAAVMNHRDEITRLPDGWEVIASTDRCRHALVGGGNVLAVQFHPEMDHTFGGEDLFRHVAFDLAGCRPDYSFRPEEFIRECQEWMWQVVSTQPALCGLSGGVDSSVAFSIGRSVIAPEQFRGVFIDNGWYRENEMEEIRAVFGNDGITYVGAGLRFYDAIEKIPYPSASDGNQTEREYRYYELVRQAIGQEFVLTFMDEAKRLDVRPRTLIQGTNAADIIESVTGLKSHHNVTGLPALMQVEVVEPLAGLYKFEIRQLAAHLGLPDEITYRQPFPGPGLAVRCWGQLSREDAPPLRRANRILEEVMRQHYPNNADRPCQYYCALAKLPSTGLMGDERVIGYAWWVRMVTAVKRESYSTLGVFRPSPAFCDELSHRLTTETRMPDGTPFVRVAYEITGKPPSTTEPH